MEKRTMSGSWKYLFMVLGAVLAAYFAVKIALGILMSLLPLLVGILVVAGVAYALFQVINRKALGGSRRTLP